MCVQIRMVLSRLRSSVFIITIGVCVITIVFGYSYPYVNSSFVGGILLVIFWIFACVMLTLWGFLICRLLKARRKMQSITWQGYPAFATLAKRMGIELNKQHPFGLVKNLNNIGVNNKRQVILGEDLLNKLDSSEQDAILAHEFAHLQKRHLLRLFLWACLPAVLVTFLIYVVWPQMLEFAGLVGWAIILMLVAIVSHSNEYQADKIAATYTRKEPLISGLRKTDCPDRWHFDYITHPSIERRIARLQNG
jgi:Zn-dependent protease with chaperone function